MQVSLFVFCNFFFNVLIFFERWCFFFERVCFFLLEWIVFFQVFFQKKENGFVFFFRGDWFCLVPTECCLMLSQIFPKRLFFFFLRRVDILFQIFFSKKRFEFFKWV